MNEYQIAKAIVQEVLQNIDKFRVNVKAENTVYKIPKSIIRKYVFLYGPVSNSVLADYIQAELDRYGYRLIRERGKSRKYVRYYLIKQAGEPKGLKTPDPTD